MSGEDAHLEGDYEDRHYLPDEMEPIELPDEAWWAHETFEVVGEMVYDEEDDSLTHLRGRCGVCGEPYDQSDPRPSVGHVGEFVRSASLATSGMEEHITAHVECGLNDDGLELA